MNKTLFAILLAAAPLASFAQTYPYQNPDLSAEQRAEDLCSRLTLEEKSQLMIDNSPAITRLGIPKFQWWNEALHGVARNGLATVFPQTIGMAASWDNALLLKVFTAVSDEARAKNTYHRHHNEYSRYQGLSFWTPNINIFRDPRWGRGMETYGEDPYLTSVMGLSVVRGLQGAPESRYAKLYACAKHFAVHSGPESERHRMDIENLSTRDLYETYLPAFKALVQQGNVKEVMCAYQRFEGNPCCGNNKLLEHILRNDWGFKGMVVSDCGAISDFWKKGYHEVSPDKEHASAKAVLAGTDVECNSNYLSLPDAVKQGLISEDKINVSVKRLLKGRFELGDFDSDSLVAWRNIPMSVVASAEHKSLALQMARETMTLLQNRGAVLPLNPNAKIMVIGPNANDKRMQWANYNGIPNETVTILEGIKEFAKNISYLKGCELCTNEVGESLYDKITNSNGTKGLKATYWNNVNMEGKPIANDIITELYNFDFSNNLSLGDARNVIMSSSYEGVFNADKAEKVSLTIDAEDGCRVIVNGDTVINRWNKSNRVPLTYEMTSEAGKKYNLKIDYERTNEYGISSFDIQHELTMSPEDVAARAKDADVVVFVGGLSPRLEGEEMRVKYEGFMGGDRTTIELPKAQREVMAALKKAGKKVVFVNCSGSAIALVPESQNADAILQAWYPGEQGGTAVAEVLFGKTNPCGKLPVTFYRNDNQLPDFMDYSMKNRTYRYMTEKPLFPFGYGLSYTTFSMTNGKVIGKIGNNAKLNVAVRNTGAKEGTAVVEMYIRSLDDHGGPIKTLRGFKRVNLKKGETKNVTIDLTKDTFERFDTNTNTVHFVRGNYEILYGTSSDAADLKSIKIKI